MGNSVPNLVHPDEACANVRSAAKARSAHDLRQMDWSGQETGCDALLSRPSDGRAGGWRELEKTDENVAFWANSVVCTAAVAKMLGPPSKVR